MNPLSPYTYTRRHKAQSVMLVALIALAVAGVYLLAGLMRDSYVTPDYTINRYLSKFSVVQSAITGALDPSVRAQISEHPAVAQIVPQKNIEISVPNIGGLIFFFRLFGLQAADLEMVLDQSGVSLAEGTLPQPGSNGVLLSEEIAAALDLEVGDVFDHTTDDDKVFPYFDTIISPLEVVGILTGDVRLGVMSYDYLVQHAGYADTSDQGLLVFAEPGSKAALETFLDDTIRSPRIEVATYTLMRKSVAKSQAGLLGLFVPIMLLVTAGVTLVVGAINQLAFARRLPEIGTLHALGYRKGWLVRRLTLETMIVAGVGWLLGLGFAAVSMAALSAAVYAPAGFPLETVQLTAFVLVVPIPWIVTGYTLVTARRALGRLDAVAIVERGQLSLERPQFKRAGRGGSSRVPRPLAAGTFYRRHRRRAGTLIGAMALMIVGTALIIFFFEGVMNAGRPSLNNLNRVSMVSPEGSPLEATEIERIRQYPAVDRVIPVRNISPFSLVMPFIRDESPLETYAVLAEDLAYLVDLYGLEVEKGHLPRPHSNEIVIPWTAARNRDLQVGDVIGNPEQPIYPDAPALANELVISGVFAHQPDPAQEVWLSFMSLEFLNDQPDGWGAEISLLVVPQTGQRPALDTWLETKIAGEQRTVETDRSLQAWYEEASQMGLFALTLMESIIAIVAALALAGLNYIFVTQRRTEFGVLNALGFSRRQLVGRVARENLFITGFAWVGGLLGCLLILLVLHYRVYVPGGFRLDFLDPTPWLYTLPIPVAVLCVSILAVSWILSRLDPIAVIERR
ncbi:MAG: ABC transporter permease [Chloroflexi bacterium]|nr:ABC transporter permease [Chloroflexota bacterium]